MIHTTKHPFCQCLHEIENNLPRTKRCFVACREHFEILKQRDGDKNIYPMCGKEEHCDGKAGYPECCFHPDYNKT